MIDFPLAGKEMYQRLPGVTFLPRPLTTGQPLPHLDVAAFVGFAEKGPLNLPVPLEDFETYQSIFGNDLPLAQKEDGQVVYANLPQAVRSFFANGGRRCYVVRVAGHRAEATRLRLPGIVGLGAGRSPRLAAISASSPGRWGANLKLATRLTVTRIPAKRFSWAPTDIGQPDIHLVAGSPIIQAGDVLKLKLKDERLWLAPVADVKFLPDGSSPRAFGSDQITVAESATLIISHYYPVLDSPVLSSSARVQHLEKLTIGSPLSLVSTGPLLAGSNGCHLHLLPDDVSQIRVGDVLRLQYGEDPGPVETFLTRVLEFRRNNQSPESATTQGEAETIVAVLSEFLHLRPAGLPSDIISSPPGNVPVPGAIKTVELLNLDILVRWKDLRLPVLSDLAFNPSSDRFWGHLALLGSSPLAPATSLNDTRMGIGGKTLPFVESANWFRTAVKDPYDLNPFPGEYRQREKPINFSPVAALAGFLAPAGSELALSQSHAQSSGGYTEAARELALTYLPIGLPETFDEADASQYLPPEPDREGTDDLDSFDESLFYDSYLAPPGATNHGESGETNLTLLKTAFDLYYLQGRRLRGMHSLLFVDEIALLSAPDATHRPWIMRDVAPAPVPPLPISPEQQATCPPETEFISCTGPPEILGIEPHYGPQDQEIEVTIHGSNLMDAGGTLGLTFGLKPAVDIRFISSTELRATIPRGVQPGPVDIHLENLYGSFEMPGGYTYTSASTERSLPVTIPFADDDLVENETYLSIHHALIVLCQGRADCLALLNLPSDYEVDRCLEWHQALHRRLGLHPASAFPASNDLREIADLSYVAVYHPWLLAVDKLAADGVRPQPPDGAISGLIASRERARQVWVAPANQPLQEVVGLNTTMTDEEWAQLFANRFNLVRSEARDFRPMSAHTLSIERSLLQISVRRLMILLRKIALQLGVDFVFESNHEVFREGVRVILEEFLGFMFERGAFAGRTRDQSFRVITDDSVNTPQSVDLGRFIALIQVAPSQPMEFITVQLTRSGEGELLAVEI